MIEEFSRGRASSLCLPLGWVAWVRDCFHVIGSMAIVERFFRRWSSPAGLIWVQLVVNSRRCCVVVLEAKKGKRAKLFVPEGLEGQGWRSFGETLGLFLSHRSPKRNRGEKVGISCCVRREDTSFTQAVSGRK